MATIFQQITEALDSDALLANLGTQANVLTDCSQRLAQLKQSPQLISNVSQTLNELPLSDFSIDANFSANFSGLSNAIPSDLSSVTGSLENGIKELTASVSEDLAQVIEGLVSTLNAISALMNMDFKCSVVANGQVSGSQGAGGGSGGNAGGGNGSGAVESSNEVAVVAESSQQLQQLNSLLQLLPEPFNVAALLDSLAVLGQKRHETSAISGTIPLLDDVIDTAMTLARWQTASANELRDDLAQSVGQLNDFIENGVTARLTALASASTNSLVAIDHAALLTLAETIVTEHNTIAAAVRTNDISTVDLSALNNALDQYEALLASLSSEEIADIERLSQQITALPADLEDDMTHLASVLRPNIPVGELANLMQALSNTPLPDESEIQASFEPLKAWLESLMATLNVEAIVTPIQRVSTSAQEAVSELEQDLSQVTVEIRALLADFEQLLDQIDIDSIKTEIVTAINNLGNQIQDLIEAIVEPLKTLVQQAVTELSGILDGFSAEDIEDAVNQALDALTGVLNKDEVRQPLEQISNGLKKVEEQLKLLSFAPITDEVVAAMDDIGDSLASIDTSALNDLLKAALATALKVVPDSLDPVTNPLLDEFDKMIDQGPVPVMETAKAYPQQLFDTLRGFQPAKLLEEPIGKPYKNLLSQMEAYKPTQLLQPLQKELDGAKQRLQTVADPAKALQQLSAPYDSLLKQFDQLQPSNLVEPLNKLIQDGVDELLRNLPVQSVLDAMDQILEPLQQVGNINTQITSLADRIDQIGTALESPGPQLESWLQTILDKVAGLTDLTALQRQFDRLNINLDHLAAASLLSAFDSQTTSFSTVIATLQPSARLNQLLAAKSGFPSAEFQSLAPSAKKDAIAAAMARFDPLEATQNLPYRLLGNCARALTESRSQLQQQFADWDQRYLAENTVLASYRIENVTAAVLVQWLREDLDKSFLKLFQALLERLSGFLSPIGITLQQLAGLTEPITEQLDALTKGPASLQGIQDALNDLIADLQGFDLSFLTDAVDEVFAEVKNKLATVDPQTLSEPLKQAFTSVLATLDFNTLIPQNEQATLDQGYLKLLETLRELSPEKLAAETIQPAYEQKILPLIDTFDFTLLLDAIIERLRNLAEELKSELARVNDSFANMKRAIPLGVSASVAISV